MELKRLPIGVEDYLSVNDYYYVDKTLIIKDLIDCAISQSFLIARPRRFGKSLMLSMINYFFNIDGDYSDSFKDKKIYQCGDKYLSYMNQYPVIHLNLKNLIYNSYDMMIDKTCELITSIFREKMNLLNELTMTDYEKEEFLKYANKRYEEPMKYVDCLVFLCELLYRRYGKKVIILIDEYDTPLNNAYQYGFYDKAIEFYKIFYTSILKANRSSLFSITTGVLQISKESIFSELNNLNVFSVTNEMLDEYFGFNEKEVCDLFKHYNVPYDKDMIYKWYGGYGFNSDLYNPWSILNYVKNEVYDYYWVNTGSNAIISNLIRSVDNSINELNAVINDEEYGLKLNTSISYKDIKNDFNTLVSFLVQGGYLVAHRIKNSESYNISVPNLEIEEVYYREIVSRNKTNNNLELANKFKNALLEGDNDLITKLLSEYILVSFSYFDLKKEKDYQIVIITLMATLFDTYLVKSEVNNRYGRCDIMLLPKDKQDIGMIIEIKKYQGQIGMNRLNKNAISAVEQIKNNEYYQELMRSGVKDIILYGMVFDERNSGSYSEKIK